MKNSKFNSLFQEAYSRYTKGNGFLVGDVVKLKSGYENLESYKKLGENVKQRIKDIISTGNNIRVGKLHNTDVAARYSADNTDSAQANLADCYEEASPGFWRNLITIPVECLEEINTGANLAPVPEGQRDTKERVAGPEKVGKHKWHKGKAINDQNELGKKQNWVKGGDYKLGEKNTELPHSNKYNDELPPKVKDLKKVKELKESATKLSENALDSLYIKILNEDVGAEGQSANGSLDSGDQLAGNPQMQSEERKGVIINGKEVDMNTIEIDDIDMHDYPDFSDAFVSKAQFVDGTPLTDDELEELQNNVDVNSLAHDSLHETKPSSVEEKVCPICGKDVCMCKKEESISQDISFKGPKTYLPGGDVNDPASAIKASKISHHGS